MITLLFFKDDEKNDSLRRWFFFVSPFMVRRVVTNGTLLGLCVELGYAAAGSVDNGEFSYWIKILMSTCFIFLKFIIFKWNDFFFLRIYFRFTFYILIMVKAEPCTIYNFCLNKCWGKMGPTSVKKCFFKL